MKHTLLVKPEVVKRSLKPGSYFEPFAIKQPCDVTSHFAFA